nr:metalloregulator ArsR/SmtB family transcription factor [uncultured Caproiciproducens sp.]
MVDLFKALSEESRLRILSLLLENEMCVCEIETALKMTQSNASRHLTTLKNCGIVVGFKEAQWTHYRISDQFKLENKELWKYLQQKLIELPSYKTDKEEYLKCKNENLCNT